MQRQNYPQPIRVSSANSDLMDSEIPMPGGSTQPADQLDWFAHFQSQTKDLDPLTAAEPEEDSSCPDEIQIQIKDLAKKISELKARLKTHVKKMGITKDESSELKDLIEKYSVKLDNIDFMGRTDALTGRRIQLLDIVLKLQKKLQSLTNIENQSKSRSGLIVEAREGKLKVNESASQNLQYLCSKNNYTWKYGISLVSIVGDRKSGKSRLFESVQNHAVGRGWEVLISAERTLESSGIICSLLCVDEMGKRRLIFLMDIVCDQRCNSEIYTKLVDFCILASDVVFYTEKEELDLVDRRNLCYWNVDRSIFATSPLCGSSTLNRPHIFALTHKLEYLYLQETSLLEFRSDRIRELKMEKESSQHSSYSLAISREGDGQKSSSILHSSCFTPAEQLSTAKEAKLYSGNLEQFLQNRQFFEKVAANSLDFGAVEGIWKQLEQITKTLETECSSSTGQWPSSSPHSTEERSTFFLMGEEGVKLVAKKAVEKYDNYMRSQTGQQIFTDSKIQRLHEHAYLILTSETVLSRFEKRQREDYLRLVNDHLRESRNYFIIQNQTRIMEKIKVRKMLTEEGKMMYSELLSKYPTSDSDSYNAFVRSVRTFAWKLYEKRAKRKNLNVAAWKGAFLSEVDALNQDIFLDNRSKETSQMKISLKDFSKEFRKLELCSRAEDEAPLSLVFHLTPSRLQAAVFIPDSTQRRDLKSEWNSPVFKDHWPPCILFRSGDTTLIGSDALTSERTSSDSFFNVCDMLLRGTKPRSTVKLNKKEETLEVEEILAMFLFKIKRQIETELNIHLNSAAFAMCSLFSTTARHMVKSSLSLAGFRFSVLLKSKMAALLAEVVLAKASNSIYDHMLLLHDGPEIIQICIQSSRPGHSLKGTSFNNLMSASNSLPLMKETIIQNLHGISHFPTFAIIKPTSPLCQDPSSQTQRLLMTALGELKNSRDSVLRNCEILVKNVEECGILLGAHLYNHPRCDRMKRVKINASKCNVVGEIKKDGSFGFFGAISVYEFRKDSEFFNQTQKTRMVLDVKLRGKDRLRILEKGVGRREVARLTRVDQDDQREIGIQIYVSSEGLLDFQLKSQGPPSEADERAHEEVQIVTKYLLAHQVEAAKVKLSKYFKARKFKVEDSWKIFVTNTDSM